MAEGLAREGGIWRGCPLARLEASIDYCYSPRSLLPAAQLLWPPAATANLQRGLEEAEDSLEKGCDYECMRKSLQCRVCQFRLKKLKEGKCGTRASTPHTQEFSLIQGSISNIFKVISQTLLSINLGFWYKSNKQIKSKTKYH